MSRFFAILFPLAAVMLVPVDTAMLSAADGSRFAHSDGDARYLHHIDLYDHDNRKITPESTRPYSTRNTCGRCHDYSTISHGWHFNAFASGWQKSAEPPSAAESADKPSIPNIDDGRATEPWIWTDPRTGTQLPLDYRRRGGGRFDPEAVGISLLEMTRKFGPRIPGGGLADPTDVAVLDDDRELADRWNLTGSLEIDCLVCHAVPGIYDFNARREAIEDENFAWAPTAAMRWAAIDGAVSRIREGSDLESERTKKKMPKIEYDDSIFGADGSVFVDLVREPDNNACYQCHSQRTVGPGGIEQRWIHDEDVHLRAGMNCVDCHRNGIDHQIVRGYPGETHLSGEIIQTLSCEGCHLGVEASSPPAASGEPIDELVSATLDDRPRFATRAGRLGAPWPAHAGFPPIHFEIMSCTACHSGPMPAQLAGGLMTSLSHGLGEKAHRGGQEMPAIRGPLYAPEQLDEDGQPDGPIIARRAVWPAYWGKLVDGEVAPLPPDEVYGVLRRPLRVRKDFIEEVVEEDEFDEKVAAGLAAIEEKMEVEQAVYVSTGTVFTLGEKPDTIDTIEVNNLDAVEMVTWPMAHNVRPAGWSLGSTGCLECHADDGLIFTSTVTAAGPAKVDSEPVTMAALQGLGEFERQRWNQLFQGRKLFKFLTAGSLLLLSMSLVIGLAAKANGLLASKEIN